MVVSTLATTGPLADLTIAESTISFPGMDTGETFRFSFLRHPIILWRAGGFLALMMLAFIALTIVSSVSEIEDPPTARVTIVILCLFFVISNLWFLVRVYRFELRVVVATDKKIHQFKRTLLAVDRHESIDLWVLQDVVKIQRSVIQNIFGFGTLKLEAQNTQLRLHFVPHIDDVYNQVVHLREQARDRTLPIQIPLEEQQAIPVQPS
jgi:hypothetical protein